MSTATPARAFISYSHDSVEHKQRVLNLANRLRSDGIDTRLDQYETAPAEGWPRWMANQIAGAAYVLVIATATYERRFTGREDAGQGLGGQWEGAILTQHLYEGAARNTKIIPVVFNQADADHIPGPLRSFSWHNVGDAAGYESLYRHLTSQPAVVAPTIGEPKRLPPKSAGSAKLADAHQRMDDDDFEAAAQLAEEAAHLAGTAGEIEVQRRALLQAARCWNQHVSLSHDAEASHLLIFQKMQRHIDAAESLGAQSGRVAAERALLARLRKEPEEVLRWAEQARNLAGDDLDLEADALLAHLQALWQLSRVEEAVALRSSAERLIDQLDGDDRLVLSATWIRTLCKADQITSHEIDLFTKGVRDLTDREAVPLRRAVVVVGEVAAELNRADRREPTISLCALACDLAEKLADSRLMVTVALQIAELYSADGEELEARSHLGKAERWLKRFAHPRSEISDEDRATLRAVFLATRGRALARLALKTQQQAKRPPEALEAALEALDEAVNFTTEKGSSLRGEVGIAQADLHFWLGRVAEALGRFQEAVGFFRKVRSDVALAHPRFVDEVVMDAWLREAEAMRLAGQPRAAEETVAQLLCMKRGSQTIIQRAEAFREYLNQQELPFLDWFTQEDALAITRLSGEVGLHKAIARQLVPLVSWWEEWHKEDSGPESELLDFWGRGGFARITTAIRARPHAAIAVDAVTVSEIARWARIFCPIFDTVVVKWKGDLGAGMVLTPMHVDYGGPDSFGGHGYSVAAATEVRENWTVALAWANPLPREVSVFLAGEALPLFRAGRLLVIPAPLVGCTQSAVGWTDDLLVSQFLGGVIDTGKTGRQNQPHARQRILDVAALSVPYIDGISLKDLAYALDDLGEWVLPLRAFLARSLQSKDLRWERWGNITSMESEIREAFREFQEKLTHLKQKHDHGSWSTEMLAGTIGVSSRPTGAIGSEPLTDLLRALTPIEREVAPWVPYWIFSTFGGRLDWTCPLDNPSTPAAEGSSESQSHSLHTWLYPGTGGWRIPTCIRLDE